MINLIVWHSLRNEWGNGSFAVINGLLHVKAHNGTKITQLGGSSPEGLARILMRELWNARNIEEGDVA